MLDAMFCLPGVYDVEIEDGALFAIAGQFTWPVVARRTKSHATWVNVEANGRSWGRLRR
jgi:hypothetical protein